MSGALALGVEIATLFEGGLNDASFAGLDFLIINHSEAPGRRALQFLFPERDTPQFVDLGMDNDPIQVTGFYVGDDYVDQAAAFRAAFTTAGPQTLVHPWLGTMQVVLCPKPRLSLSTEELRVLRISFSAWVYTPPALAAPDTLSTLLSDLAAVRTAVGTFLNAVLVVPTLINGAVSLVNGFAGTLAGAWETIGLVLGTDPSAAALTPAVTALGTIDTVTPGTGYPAGVAALLAAPSAALAAAVSPPVAAAVGPGSVSATPPQASATVVASALLTAVPAIGALPDSVAPTAALIAATQGYVVADTCQVVSAISFDSQQDAQGWLDQALAALDVAAANAAAQAVTWPVAAGALWRALIEARSALSDDMTALIGRLPAVQTLVLPAQTDLWMVAQYLAGDDPTQVLGMYLDLRARNDVINPAIVIGSLETLA